MNSARILIAEDEYIVSKEIEMRLAAMGYQVAGAVLYGEEALKLAEQLRPDLVLMDIRLKGTMDGITAAEEIRRRFHLPVIFLTAYSEDATLERAKLAEPYGYIIKPFDDRELKSTIEIALHKHRTEKELFHLNRLYDVLSQVNQVVVRVRSREALFEAVCRILVERGGIDLAWIGWLDTASSKIIPVAQFGKHESLMRSAEFYADDRPEGQGNPGKAIREGIPFICNGCKVGTCLYPFDYAPVQFGFSSCGSFPIFFQGQAYGVLSLGVEEAVFFQKREIDLLKEIAMDISFALDKLEGDARRAQAEEALRKSEEQYRLLVETSNEGVWAMDSNHVTTYINLAMAEMLGYQASEIIGTNVEAYFFPEDQSFHQERMRQRHAGEDDVYERRFRRRNGLPLWTLVSAKALKDDQGRFLGSFAMFTDITEQKQSEQALSQKNRQLEETVLALERAQNMMRLIIESIPVRVFWKDRELRYLGCNSLFARDGGFHHPQELLGKNDFAMSWREQAELYRADDRQVMASGLPRMNIVEPQTTPAGSKIWLNTSKVPLCIPDGEVIGVLGVYEDITDRKQAEAALRESEEKQRSILKAAPIGIGVVVERVLTEVNDYLCTMTGYSKEELLGQNARILYPTQEHYAYVGREKYRQIAEKGTGTVETQWKRKDGVVIDILLSSTPIHRDDLLAGVTFTAIDITERKRAEEAKERLESQLRHAQKLEAIGTLAGGIAHDFNNILSPIIGYTEMAIDGIDATCPSRYDLDQVLTAANRAKDLVRQILSFSRLGEDQLMRPVDVSLIVKEALKLLRSSLPTTIEIRQDVQKATIVADATQIHQVIVNLCTNAAHAMDDVGILSVFLKEVLLSAQDIIDLSLADLRPGKHLKLSVKDTGIGMNSDMIQRIFDPYFTTKDVGKGTGLGLAVVHGIVKRHGGEIFVWSEAGKGSVFDVFIPIVEVASKYENSVSQELPKGNERILLVDDEPVIAAMVTKMLEQLGYTVTAKTRPMEALDVFMSEFDRFDLIITDYTMPQMLGTRLAAECMRIRAEIPVIVCTGHNEKLIKEKPDAMAIKAIAMKPLDRKQLGMLIRDVLDTSRA